MKIPAIRAKIGDWEYYVTTLTFAQVNEFVSKIDTNLYQSESLSDLIQRSITDNYIRIKEYILNQPELFFNALVLAVYDDYPLWQEIEIKYDDAEIFYVGLLDFPSNHKIFPVDGQHRVEGIKEALKINPELKSQRIAAIFIGHKNDLNGKQRTRRLFTTLNRYAKPVKIDDIIALDEDDVVAIATRNLLEGYPLFTGQRIVYTKQKAIPVTNKSAITSIITLYQANIEIFKTYFKIRFNKKPTNTNIAMFLKYRPNDVEIRAFEEYLLSYWEAFESKLNFVSDFLALENNPAETYRNNENGGNLIFRPIGFLPLIKASLVINERTNQNFDATFERFNEINFNINTRPWIDVVWNPIERKMIMNSNQIIFLLLLFLYDDHILTTKELIKLKKGYAAKISFAGDSIENVLDGIK